MTHKALIALLLLGVALALRTTPAFADPTPGNGFDVVRYDLALTPDIKNRTVAGRETITLRVTGDGIQRLSFSGNALNIDSATVGGVAVVSNLHGGALNFDLSRPLARGRIAKLEVSYHGRPARGFACSATMLYTSYFACDWMVCLQNQFGDKAAFSLDLRVPAGMDTLSVGRRIAKRPGPDGSEIHSWKAPRPYSPYLFGFAVGRFARTSERIGSARLSYLSDVADAADLKRRFAATGEMVRFLADKAGVSLPVAEYSQLLVKGDEAQDVVAP